MLDEKIVFSGKSTGQSATDSSESRRRLPQTHPCSLPSSWSPAPQIHPSNTCPTAPQVNNRPIATRVPPRMYNLLQIRRDDLIAELQQSLTTLSLIPRLMPTSTPTPSTAHSSSNTMQRSVRSSASTPSLRARDGTVPPHARADPGGNVRVVVRVRAFLPRGTFCASISVWGGRQAGEGGRMK